MGEGFLSVVEDRGGRPSFFALYSSAQHELLASFQIVSGVAAMRGEEQGTLLLYNGKKKFCLAFDEPDHAAEFLTAVEDVALVSKMKTAVFVLISKRQLQDQTERLAASALAIANERAERQRLEAEVAELKREVDKLQKLLQSSEHAFKLTASASDLHLDDWVESPDMVRRKPAALAVSASAPPTAPTLAVPVPTAPISITRSNDPSQRLPLPSVSVSPSAASLSPAPHAPSSAQAHSPASPAAQSTSMPAPSRLSLSLPTDKIVPSAEANVLRGMSHRARLASSPHVANPLSVRGRTTMPASPPSSAPKGHRRRLSEPFTHSWERCAVLQHMLRTA